MHGGCTSAQSSPGTCTGSTSAQSNPGTCTEGYCSAQRAPAHARRDTALRRVLPSVHTVTLLCAECYPPCMDSHDAQRCYLPCMDSNDAQRCYCSSERQQRCAEVLLFVGETATTMRRGATVGRERQDDAQRCHRWSRRSGKTRRRGATVGRGGHGVYPIPATVGAGQPSLACS